MDNDITLPTHTTQNDFLGGRLQIHQPRHGYRAGVDPVFLAAATPALPGQSVLELGCGAGVASLCLGARVANLRLNGVEIQQKYADLARENAAQNGLDMAVACCDLRKMPDDIRQNRYDHVIANPPYFQRDRSTSAQDAGRDIALGGDTPLDDWIDIAARRLAPKGFLTLILRIERLPDTLSALENRLGSIIVQPLVARQNRAAHLFLLQARKGGRADFKLNFPKILHAGPHHEQDGDDYRPEITDILRNGAAMPLKP